MQKQSFELFADYFQFYLWDEEVGPDAPIDYTDEDIVRRLKAVPHVVVVQPVRNMSVPVSVEIHPSEPAFEESDWDHIAECSLSLPSGGLQVHECIGGSIARFDVTPGTYRVRAFYGALDSLNYNGLKGDDHYTIVLWPAAEAELRVLKQWNGPAGRGQPDEHAVLVHFTYGSTDLTGLFDLEDRLEQVIKKAGVGDFDGHDSAWGDRDDKLYMYGPDADALFLAVRPALEAADFMRGAKVVLRYGPPGEGVRTVEIEFPLVPKPQSGRE